MNAETPSLLPTNFWVFETHSPDQTIAMGCALGRRMHQGMALLLYGELGSGKTAFAQGVARGIGIPESCPVTSPTYTLINEYAGRLPFYHVDLYRLPTPVEPDEIGLMELFDADGIIAVEWAQRLDPADRPHQRLELFFTITGDTRRSIRVIAYGLDPADLLKDIDISTSSGGP